ncbi:hypothetical protein EK904_004744, partial [Melospiza melodia maxima]
MAAIKGFWMLLTVPHALSWVIPPASCNVWVTLARTLKQDSLCLSVESPYNPQSTCLVGLPMDEWPSSLHPRRLPKGVFLVCGDQAWPRIPPRPQGGPCSLGRLALLSPDLALIQGWKRQLAPKRRSLNEFDKSCDSQISSWSKGKRVTDSLLLPWVAAAEALRESDLHGKQASTLKVRSERCTHYRPAMCEGQFTPGIPPDSQRPCSRRNPSVTSHSTMCQDSY